MSRRLVVVIDYGVGNVASVAHAVRRAGHRPIVSRDRDIVMSADLILLPGVGAFPAAMRSLRDHDLVDLLRLQAGRGQPLLGICLGMQLLAERSLENGLTEGLGLIAGEVNAHPRHLRHIGWSQIAVKRESSCFAAFNEQYFYFNHSFFFRTGEAASAATACYDGEFVAAVEKRNIIGVQFHPEKSQIAGDRLMSRLIEHMTS